MEPRFYENRAALDAAAYEVLAGFSFGDFPVRIRTITVDIDLDAIGSPARADTRPSKRESYPAK